MATPSGNNIQRIKDAGKYPAFELILAAFVVPDAHAAVIDIVDRLGLKGQAAISAFVELQRDAKIQPGFLSKLGTFE
jgi:hypothetical protein